MKNILIIVCGASASGKTTVVNSIKKAFKENELTTICMDNYYKDQSNIDIETRKLTNYDHPDSFDLDLLYNDITMLLNGMSINSPIYDFINHTRSDKTNTVIPNRVIILEGILALYKEELRDLASIKIFVDLDDDIRFIRRLKRDMTERKRDINSIINQYLSTVKPMYHEFIEPTKRYADIIIPNLYQNQVGVDLIVHKINKIIKE